jgi:hypothetical protein
MQITHQDSNRLQVGARSRGHLTLLSGLRVDDCTQSTLAAAFLANRPACKYNSLRVPTALAPVVFDRHRDHVSRDWLPLRGSHP